MSSPNIDNLFALAHRMERGEQEEFLAALMPEIREQVQALLKADLSAERRGMFDPLPDAVTPANNENQAAFDETFVGAQSEGKPHPSGHQQNQNTVVPTVLPADPGATAIGTEDTVDQQDATPQIDGYVLHKELARGGMGVVYEASDTKLDRAVAIKLMLRSDLAAISEKIRFEREARSTARLMHRNIVTVYEFGFANELPFLAMEFVTGPTLRQQIDAHTLSANEAARIVREIALAIGYAHDNGVIHRDLKPANILMDGGVTPRVTDFGLARSETDAQLTATEAIMGTPSYMAPEQAAGRMTDVGPRSDIYAMGAILYCCLTGVAPHKAENAQLTLMKVLESTIIPPSERNTTVPRDLESVCLKCLARQPDHRYPSANELVADLDRFLDSKPVLARPRRFREKAEAWIRRNVALLAIAIALLVVLPGTLLVGDGFGDVQSETIANQRRHLQFLEQVLRKNPDDSAAWLSHADWNLQVRQYAECLKDLAAAEKSGNPDMSQINRLRCKAFIGQKDWTNGLQTACLLLSHNLQDAEAHFMTGRCFHELTDYKNAILSLSTAIELRPDYLDAYQFRSKAFTKLKDEKSAEADNRSIALLENRNDHDTK